MIKRKTRDMLKYGAQQRFSMPKDPVCGMEVEEGT